jgi:hypothetical protein
MNDFTCKVAITNPKNKKQKTVNLNQEQATKLLELIARNKL